MGCYCLDVVELSESVAHIHLEDGSFSLFWVLAWWIAALCLIGIALFFLRSKYKPDSQKITIAAFVTAAAFAIFQVQIPVAGGIHLEPYPPHWYPDRGRHRDTCCLHCQYLFFRDRPRRLGAHWRNVLVNCAEVLVAWFVYRSMKQITTDLFSRAGVGTFPVFLQEI